MQNKEQAMEALQQNPASFKVLVEHLKEAEGLRLSAYQDVAGAWTIGYGHAHGVTKGMRITVADAERILVEDICDAYVGLTSLNLRLNEWQTIALIDFCFQFGAARFKKSSLYTAIASHQPQSKIVEQFRKWIYYRSCGRMVPSAGLIKRCDWRVKMWKRNI